VDFHLNLYGFDENGEEVLMTRDHIIPVSRGGKNHLSNYQVYCWKCNIGKGGDLGMFFRRKKTRLAEQLEGVGF